MNRTWFVAHARGCDFALLEKRGFTTFYPSLDDYVFLEDTPDNQKMLRKQSELGIKFVSTNRGYTRITEKELNRMSKATVDRIKVSQKVLAVGGIASNLEGTVREVSEEGFLVEFLGLYRTFMVLTKRTELVPINET